MPVSDPTSLAAASLREGLLLIALPLGVILGVGLLVSVLQAATQLQDMSISFVPKLAAAALTLWLFGPALFKLLAAFTVGLWLKAAGL